MQQLPKPPHLAASLFGSRLPPVSLSNAALCLAEAVAAARGCPELWTQPPQPTAHPGALQNPLEDMGFQVLFKPCVLKSPGRGLSAPPKALSHQTEICRDLTAALGMSTPFRFEEPHPAPSPVTEGAKPNPRV